MDRFWSSLKIRLFRSLLNFNARLEVVGCIEHAYQTCIAFAQKVVALSFEKHLRNLISMAATSH